MHRAALGDLQAQQAGVDAGPGEQRRHLGGEGRVEQRTRRDVDGHRDLESLFRPVLDLVQCLRENVPRQAVHQLAALHQGEEVGGLEQATRRVLPADQGLDPEQPAVAEGDLRLVVHDQLVGRQRVPKLTHQPHLVGGVDVVVDGVDDEALAGALGHVHRDVGTAQ